MTAPEKPQGAESRPAQTGGQQSRPQPPKASSSALETKPSNGPRAIAAPVPPKEPKLPLEDRYIKAGLQPFETDIQEKLSKPVDPKIVEITPDGRIYVPAVHFRRALNEAFGRGGWALIPWSDRIMKGTHMYREYALYALGQFLGETVGEQEYIEKNRRFTYGDAAEGCESNALMRCAKKLDIYSEVWDPGWRDRWKREHAVCVKCEKRGESQTKWLWKRRDRGALYSSGWKEIGADTDQGKPSRPQASRPAGGGQRTQAKTTQQRRPPDKSASSPKSGVQRDPNAALYARVMTALKRGAHTSKEEDARNLLEQLTGKRRCHDIPVDTLKAILQPLLKLSRQQARVEQSGDTNVVVDTATGAYIWPPGYTPPEDDSGPQAPVEDDPEDASPPVSEDGAPPLGDEDVPPGSRDFGF